MATVQRYVNTGSAGGDGTTNGTAGGTAAYASLSSWEANQSPSGTDDLVVDCCGSSADTTAVTCDWSTAPASVTIRANASDPAGKYNGSALISTAHYRLQVASGSALMMSEATNFTIDGLQVEASGGSFRVGIGINAGNASGTYTIQNNRVRGSSSTRTGIGMPGTAVGFDGQTVNVINNIISGFDVAAVEFINSTFRNPTWNIYQNTLYGDGSANLIRIVFDAGGSPVANIKNNCGWNSGGTAELSVAGTGTANYDKNAFQDGNGTTNEITLTSSAATWVSASVNQNADFTPATGSQLLGAGATGLSITTDINGITRDSPPDIGAVEVAAGGGSTTRTINVSLDAAIQRQITVATALSAAVQTTNTATAQVGAAIQAARSISTNLDASVLQTRSVLVSLDAALRQARTAAISLDAMVQGGSVVTTSLDAAVQTNRTANTAVDAAVQTSRTVTPSFDAAIRAARTASVSLDAFIQAGFQVTALLDAAIQTNRSAIVSLDAGIQTTRTVGVALGAVVQVSQVLSAYMDAAVQLRRTANVSVDAAIQQARTASTSLDALIISSFFVTAQLDAAIRSARSAVAWLDAYIDDPSALPPVGRNFTVPARSGFIVPPRGGYTVH